VLRLSIGPLLLVLAWLAMVEGRTRGLNFLLSTFCLVWMADIAAYFGGTGLGVAASWRRRSARARAGKASTGGMVGVLALALGWLDAASMPLAVDGTSLFAHVRGARLGRGGSFAVPARCWRP
jgi:phosphatidate cytidylyltransferase